MNFAHPHLEEEWSRLHPAVRAIAHELNEYLGEEGMELGTITHAIRSEASMAAIYGLDWKKKGRFSWHLVKRAVDIRNRDWSEDELERVVAWLKKNWPGAEVISHDIGHGNHLHLAVPAPRSAIRRLRRWLTRKEH